MARVVIRDFVLSLGFDAQEVIRGLSTIERRLQRVSASRTRAGQGRARAAQQAERSTRRTTNELARQNRLDRARLSLQRSIFRARQLGADTRGLSNSLRSENIDVINRAQIRANQVILESQRNIAAAKEREARAAERVRATNARARATAQEENRLRRQREQLLRREANALIANSRREERERENRLRREANAVIANRRRQQRTDDIRQDIDARASRLGARIGFQQEGINLDPRTVASLQSAQNQVARLRRELQRTDDPRALRRISRQLQEVSAQANLARQAQARFNREVTLGQTFLSGLNQGLMAGTRGFRGFGAAAAVAVGTLGILASIPIGQTLIQLQASLLAASGSSEQAAADFEFLSQQSLRLGINLTETTRGFQQFGIAARSAGFSSDETRDLFVQVSEAAVGFGLSTDDTAGVFRAFSQTLSRGVVSMEELRGQLGDRLPGAFQVAARSMGLTETELTRLVESGSLASGEFLRNFIPALNQTVTESGALAASLNTSRVAMNRFRTSFELNVLRAFDAGAEQGLADLFNDLTDVLGDLSGVFRVIGRLIGGVAQVFGTLARVVGVVGRLIEPVFDTLFGSTIRDGNDQLRETQGLLSGLVTVAERFAAALLFPFALLEQILDSFDSGGVAEAGNTALNTLSRSPGIAGNVARLVAPLTRPAPSVTTDRQPTQVNIVANEEGRIVSLIMESLQAEYATSFEVLD